MDSTSDPNTAAAQQMDTPKSLMDSQIHSSENSTDLQSSPKNHYESPPASITEAVSPVSSRNRGQLRAANLGISPTVTAGLARRSLSFGAVVDNIPAPITTQTPYSSAPNFEQLREPRPATQLRSIEESVHGHPRNPSMESQLLPGHSHNSMAQWPSQGSLSNLHASGEQSGNKNGNPFSNTNPYTQRADEIGPSHHIPGIGHLGDLLTPPGWKEGDAPISPESANQLFGRARIQATQKLKADVTDTQNLPPHEQKIFYAEKDRQWNVGCMLDKVLLNERLNVYEQYQIREDIKHGLKFGEQKNQSNFETLEPPQPVNPPTNTSFSNSPKPVFPYSPAVFGGRSRNAFDRNSPQSHRGSRSLSTLNPEFMSPAILDPSLLPQTLESIYQTYEARQADISRQSYENHQFLISWVSHYGPHLSQQQLSPGILPPLNGNRAKPFFGTHDSFPPTGPNGQTIPRPPPYQPPNRYHYEGTSNPLMGVPQAQTYEPPLVSRVQPEMPPGFELPTFRELSYLYDKETGENIRRRYCRSESGDAIQMQNARPNTEDNSTLKKKRAAKPKTEKAKPWYHDQLAAANLPTSEISQKSMQAGIDYDPKKGKEINPSQPKRRQRKPIIDPAKGFPISEAAARILISKGAIDRRPKASVVPSSSTPATMAPVVPSCLTAVPRGVSTKIFPYMPSPHSTASDVFSRDAQPEKAPNSTISSDCEDDPKDGDFGKRMTRRKTPSPRKRDNPVGMASGINKRKSGGGSVPNKRSRLSLDGQFDSSKVDNVGDDGSSAQQHTNYQGMGLT